MRIRPSVTLTPYRHYRHRRACRVRILGERNPVNMREEVCPGLQKAVYAGLVKPTPEERDYAHAFNRITLRSAWSYLSESHAVYLAKRYLGLSGHEALQWVRPYIPHAAETPEQQRLVLHDDGSQ
jgi:hypothetical protein